MPFQKNNKLALCHGKSYSRVYGAWRSMISRCSNPQAQYFQYYGGKGITVCDRWKQFENFYADMGDPVPGMTLDRYPNRRRLPGLHQNS
jgi:hypothetical protein